MSGIEYDPWKLLIIQTVRLYFQYRGDIRKPLDEEALKTYVHGVSLNMTSSIYTIRSTSFHSISLHRWEEVLEVAREMQRAHAVQHVASRLLGKS